MRNRNSLAKTRALAAKTMDMDSLRSRPGSCKIIFNISHEHRAGSLIDLAGNLIQEKLRAFEFKRENNENCSYNCNKKVRKARFNRTRLGSGIVEAFLGLHFWPFVPEKRSRDTFKCLSGLISGERRS
jgi:hypothetical protein